MFSILLHQCPVLFRYRFVECFGGPLGWVEVTFTHFLCFDVSVAIATATAVVVVVVVVSVVVCR